jgi:peptidoglycan glycosyltransferase
VLGPDGRPLRLPTRSEPRRVMSLQLTEELRGMMVRTTTHGTARSAFRDRRGRPKLGPVLVAGKTGNLTGSDPYGRYEWFIGAAPASEPTIAIAVLQLQSNLWWSKSSEIGANVLSEVFCDGGDCSAARAQRLTGDLGEFVRPILLSDVPID